MSITAKSVILDIADNYGDSDFVGVRFIEFFLAGALIEITTEFTAYATTNGGTGSLPEFAFNTSLLKTGTAGYTTWTSTVSQTTNQRLIIVFDTPTEFDSVIVSNYFSVNGFGVTRGINNTVITASTDAITDTTYNAAITNPTVLFDGIVDAHVASEAEDTQVVYTAPIVICRLNAPIVSVDSIGELPITGYTDFISPIVSIASTGTLPITGYTDISPIISVDGVGELPITGYTDVSVIVSVDCAGELPIVGWGDVISIVSVESTADVYHSEGLGNVVPSGVSIIGSGDVSIISHGIVETEPVSVSGVGVNAIRGAGYVKPKLAKIFSNYSAIGKVEVSSAIDAYGNVSIIGVGTVVTRPAVVTGYGRLSLLATTNYEVSLPTLTGTGIIYQTGRGVVAVPLPTVTTYGYLQSTGIGSFNVKPPVIICHANQPDDYTVIRHNREGVCH
jgi:hypothetical protein